jgi:hypothetical protein
MLDRPPPADIDAKPSQRERRRLLRNERKRRLAARKAVGLACCTAEYDGTMLQFLLDHVSMDDGSDYGDDPVKIGKAISAWWREAAYGTKK